LVWLGIAFLYFRSVGWGWDKKKKYKENWWTFVWLYKGRKGLHETAATGKDDRHPRNDKAGQRDFPVATVWSMRKKRKTVIENNG